MDEDMTCTSTENFDVINVTEIDYFLEYEIIMRSRGNQMFNRLQETETAANNALLIMIYGLGALLGFFVIYTLCTAYCHAVREQLDDDRRERQAREARDQRLRTRLTRSPSTPLENEDRRFFPENFQDMFNLNTIPKQRSQSQENVRPSHVEINMDSSPEKADRQARASPDRISRSTPSSTTIVRRQLHGLDEVPRRPSSWW